MTATILTARPAVEQIKKELIERCQRLKKQGITPSMSVILVGDNPASLSYIRNKKKLCEEVGAHFQLHQWPANISVSEFLMKTEALNTDQNIHGIIIQLPVSEHLRNLDIPHLISAHKDIDGFHGANTQKLYMGSTDMSLLTPCTPKGVITLLKHYKLSLEGKHVVVVGRSLIVGKPLSMLLSNFNATVTLAHSRSENLKSLTQQADIVISAIGQANFFDATFFDKNKRTIVIDVGMNTLNGKLVGDVNQADVMPVVAALSPVPGGVGPMTVLSLIQNLITATENQMKGKK